MARTSWHVAVAAEAIAAAQFARCGFDVSVQYGANQPEYDLIVAKGERLLKVSVKGSRDGGWGLTQSNLKAANYHEAIDTAVVGSVITWGPRAVGAGTVESIPKAWRFSKERIDELFEACVGKSTNI